MYFFINVFTVFQNGDTAVHLAAKKGHDGVVALLLDHGADINQVLADRALSLVCCIAQPGTCKWTPLMNAAANNQLSTCWLLLERGARVDLVDDVWHFT